MIIPYAAKIAIALNTKVPGAPDVTQTHPGVVLAAGALFQTMSPLVHVPVVGTAAAKVTI